MPKKEITDLIKKLESLRKSRILAYVTADGQPPFRAKIALDIIPIFYRHLERMGKSEKIDLFLYSTGGDIMPPWRLVNLIREYCGHFSVLVPYKAHSAATMIALGADEILMGPLGELSPIDPNIGTPFNPPHPDVPNEPKVEISVEDVFGYINLAKEKLSIDEQASVVNILGKLIDKIHPLALGAVYRTHSLIRLLASRLLSLHMDDDKPESIQKIIEYLVEKLYYHGYLVNRKEAKSLGLKVRYPSAKLAKAQWELYQAFIAEMGFDRPFNPMQLFPPDSNTHKMDLNIACICSRDLHSSFKKSIELTKIPLPQPGAAPQIRIEESIMGWSDSEIAEEE